MTETDTEFVELRYGKGTWEARSFAKVNPEIILVFLARSGLHYRRLRKENGTPPVSREVKDLLIRHTGEF
jgi:hypothetical protein